MILVLFILTVIPAMIVRACSSTRSSRTRNYFDPNPARPPLERARQRDTR